ncbi:protein yellow-like [Culicoides brevitarsis]|uniref:protein yellow-like n=1 Tax=Culicoides brevitarsis TaxID=469753 RepID=UPI00307C27EF
MHQSKIITIFTIITWNHAFCFAKFDEVFSWTELDWNIPENIKQSDQYIPRNGLPVGIERWNDKLFVSVPRWRNGVPATLNYIDLNLNPTGFGVPLVPYPSLANNIAGDCDNGLSTVYRIKADRCNRLWVLDVGTTGIGDTTQQLCPYALNIFDLNTNRRIRRYIFRHEDTNLNTFIANILVDVGDTCEDSYAYFSDELGYGLIVYSFEENTSWRFEHGFFFPDPLRGDFNIGGLNFQWFDEGIFGMSLGPKLTDGTRSVFFSPLASFREFYVSNSILKNSSKPNNSYHDFYYLEERAENGHTTSRVIDETQGVQLFNLIDLNAIGCWDTKKSYSPFNHGIVDQNNETMIFPADIKVDVDQNVWIISDRMPNFLISTLDYNDINFRIFTAKLEDLIKGTICDPNISLQINKCGSDSDDYSPYLGDTLSYFTYPFYGQTVVEPNQQAQLFNPDPPQRFQGHENHNENSWVPSNDDSTMNYFIPDEYYDQFS